jgi:predicted DNA binding CopG/RHH family protein
MDTPMLSRSGSSNPLGKCDRRLDTLVSEDLENAVIAMATMRGLSKSEYVRLVLERSMFGEFPMMQKIVTRGE